MRFQTVLIVGVVSLPLLGCNTDAPIMEEAAVPADVAPTVTSGLAAAAHFMATWNTRDPEVWAGSLNFPHTRPAAGGHRVWQTKEDYVATTDYARVIATGWDHTEFEDLRLVHETDTKAHVAGRWLRVDTDGNPIRRNLVTYIATQIDGRWGIKARFGAGAPLPDDTAQPIADIATATVESYLSAFNARDPVAWAATLNYPHLRIAGGDLRVWETENDYAGWMDFEGFAERTGWDRSVLDEIEVVQAAENGANVAVTFTRFTADEEIIATFDALYLVTNENGRWGVRARSSFAQ